jgi:hypothetical protein
VTKFFFVAVGDLVDLEDKSLDLFIEKIEKLSL